eukprot:CAMPEP_0171188114 /NCGR_PEP_ID=MMETSP0790-20130122/17664_1 /TAXON_ID=2925 /ORGANISM="Alexandrium catenella, Strain OF101" /LENGTH=336 /DNA_ID=CAMNT_0011653185 /DNA_START=1 /DNA_END=1007 /DNA_ORIENTATION=+
MSLEANHAMSCSPGQGRRAVQRRGRGCLSGEGLPRPPCPSAAILVVVLRLAEEDVGTQHVLAASKNLRLFLHRAAVPLRVEQRQPHLGFEQHRVPAGAGVEGAEAALEGALPHAIEEDPQRILGDPAILPPHRLVRVPAGEVAWHELLDPHDVVEPAGDHAVDLDTAQELAQATDGPNPLAQAGVEDVLPVELQLVVAVLPAEALPLREVYDLRALIARQEAGQAHAIHLPEVDRLRKPPGPREDKAQGRRLRDLLHGLLRRRRLGPLLRELDLEVEPDAIDALAHLQGQHVRPPLRRNAYAHGVSRGQAGDVAQARTDVPGHWRARGSLQPLKVR